MKTIGTMLFLFLSVILVVACTAEKVYGKGSNHHPVIDKINIDHIEILIDDGRLLQRRLGIVN